MARRDKKKILKAPDPAVIRARRDADRARRELAAMVAADQKRRSEREPKGFGVNENALTMAVNQGIEVKRDNKGKVQTAWKTNPFKLLADSGTLSQDEANAAHDAMAIYAASKGLDGAAPPMVHDRVDGNDPDAWGREDRKQWNVKLWGLIIGKLSGSSAKLAYAFAVAIVEEDRPMVWRGIVERVLGEVNPSKQTGRVEAMCEEMLDHIPKCREVLKREYDRRAA